MIFEKINLKKEDVEYISSKYSIRDIECSLIELFLEENNIKIKNNQLIKDYIQNTENTKKIKEYFKKIDNNISLKLIERVFELLIPIEDRETNGAFYTPSFIIKYIVNNTITKNQTVCDPSCGCGGFLLEATRKLKELTNKSIKEIIENNIFGCDILDYSIRRTKILLSLLMLEYGEDENNIKFNLINKDSLLINWSEFFPNNVPGKGLFKFNTKELGFDAIIGNPPYLRIQDLDENTKSNILKQWNHLHKGNFNIYFAFFYLGMELLNTTGKLGYITPNNYFTSLSAKNLREWILPKTEKIIDFKHLKIFEDASTYTCITILSKSSENYLKYKPIKNEEKLKEIFNENEFSKIKYDELNSKKWRLLKNEDSRNIRQIETIGVKLGELTDIKNGIATLRDKLYIINTEDEDKNYYYTIFKNKKYPIEKEITKNIIKISNIKTQEDIQNNKQKIIFPYKYNPTLIIINEEEMLNNYPKCYEYFLDIKEELSKRDKGKKKYDSWYAYGRKQGLGFNEPKLLTPTFSKKPRFLYDPDKSSLYCNGYALFLKTNKINLKILKKIVNSIVMEYYINKTSVNIEGGFPCYQKNFIELFSIPEFEESEKEFLEREENKEKIDKFLIKKYDLNLNIKND